MTQANVNKIVKRIQSDLKRKGIPITMSQGREVYLSLVANPENPTGEELGQVTQALKDQLSTTYQAPPNNVELVLIDETSDVQASTEDDLEIQKPVITEITPESNPDIWETLQPPAQPTEQPTESALVKTEETQLATSAPGATIPQSEVKELVASTFSGQPPEFTDQITEYAVNHSFENVRQVQDFLEQLRGMEFNLLVTTLQDHFNRRGSMLSVLDEVIESQRQKDQDHRENFLGKFNNRLQTFQQEMSAKLAKQSI